MLAGPARNSLVALVPVDYNAEKQVAQWRLALPGYVENIVGAAEQTDWG